MAKTAAINDSHRGAPATGGAYARNILVVLVTAGAGALKYSLPITGAIVVLLAALVISYRQVMRGLILDRAIRHGTANVVLCRLRYRLSTLIAQDDQGDDEHGERPDERQEHHGHA